MYYSIYAQKDTYITSGSNFVTGGYTNPTFTIIKLAIRLAEKISERMYSAWLHFLYEKKNNQKFTFVTTMDYNHNFYFCLDFWESWSSKNCKKLLKKK